MIFLVTTIIVGVFGVVPLPEYGNLTSNMEFDGKIIYRVEIESQNLIPPAPDIMDCLLYTSPSPRDRQKSRMPSSA